MRAAAMPKMKTHSGAKKRFRFTGTGKVMHRKAGKMHLNEHKPSTRTRRLAGDAGALERRRGQGPQAAGPVERPHPPPTDSKE